MNIKSLLLGSAAAMVAVSGARAADAIVIAEPEPMEYVRVCDVYGTGFYYIPGTETCLRVGGYIRVDIAGGEALEDTSNFNRGTWSTRSRLQLRLDARSETELGTLRGYAAINFNYQDNTQVVVQDTNANGVVDAGDAGFFQYDAYDQVGFEHIYIELGGFRVGKTDSMFSTFTDYSAGVLNDGLVPYGPFETQQLAYTYTGANGFSAAIALELGDDTPTGVGPFPAGRGGRTQDYAPFVVGGVSLTQGWGKVGVVAGWDTWSEEFAVKGRLDVNVAEGASVFIMGAWDSADNNGPNYYAPWGGSWAIWGGAAVALNEKATLNAEIGYDDDENFSIAANVAYELVPGLTITPEIVYTDNFNVGNSDALGGQIRFQRSF